MARDLTWYNNLVMLVEARATESCFSEDTGNWAGVAAHRDGRLREILEEIRVMAVPGR